jgi:tartrate-resistant acid phosphatase type 5
MIRTAYPLIAASLFLAMSACGSSEDGSDRDKETQSGTVPGTSSGGPGPGTPSNPTGGVDASTPAVPTSKAVRFVAMGDTGTGSPDQHKIANAISAKCAKDGCDFVQLLGDNLYDSGASSVNDTIWQEKFETPYAAINLDFFAVLGNHDYGGGGAGTDFPKGKNEIDYTKKSTKWKMPAAYYHHVKSNVEFFALDTNMQLFGQDSSQKTDMNAWIAASTAEWKIAFGHHPYKSNGPHGNAGKYDGIPIPPVSGSGVKSFLENVVCGKVDVYLSGHDHSQQWLNESCKGTELAVSGAGAKTTELGGNNPSLFQSLELGFLYIVIDGKKLTAEFVDENNVVEFTHTTTKP